MEERRRTALLCGLSDGAGEGWKAQGEELMGLLGQMGISCRMDPLLEAKERGRTEGRERAAFLNEGLSEASFVFDVSGGNMALEALPWIDLEGFRKWDGLLFGYSDLTCILNALTERTKKPTVLYQVRNLLGTDEAAKERRREFQESLSLEGPLYDFPFAFLNGERMEGITVGGNVRCLLKLAGTPYWPDMKGRILTLEALGGDAFALKAFFAQLSLMGVFEEISGVLLGTFTQLSREEGSERAYELIRGYLPSDLPVARTDRIGHGRDSKALIIGARIVLQKGEKVSYG